MKPTVYIASPFTLGDQSTNVHYQVQLFSELYKSGYVIPVAPLWSVFQHIATPMSYECWMEIDFAMVRVCDSLYRGNAELTLTDIDHRTGRLTNTIYRQEVSHGADREVEHAKALNKPVFYDIGELYRWAEEFTFAATK